MKNSLCIIFLVLMSFKSYSQNNDGKKVEFQFQKRVSFYAVDERYQLILDTIYYADDGFRVFSGYDITTAQDGNEYVIFRYNRWRNTAQVHETKNNQLQSLIADSVFLNKVEDLYGDNLDKQGTYNDFIDILKTLAENELNLSPVHVDIKGRDNLILAMLKTHFEQLIEDEMVIDVYSLSWKHSTKFATGLMTIPFKFRPQQDSVNFNMSTDITLGPYFGIKKRISRRENRYILIPATLGISYINVGNSETSNVNTENNSSVVPGFTWSSGLVFDLNGFNLGFVFGADYASGVGEDWLYNKKLWYSFSIGYSFFNSKDD